MPALCRLFQNVIRHARICACDAVEHSVVVWWNGGPLQFFSSLTIVLTALSTLGLAIFAIASGRLEGLPFRWLLFALLLLTPMLHYITVMEDTYTYVDRICLAIIGMFAIFNSPRLRLKAFSDSAI